MSTRVAALRLFSFAVFASFAVGASCGQTALGLFPGVINDPGNLALRKANRPDHLAYLESLGETLIFAGPFTEADGQTMNGSLIVVEAASLDAARTIGAGDPFAKAGVFANVEIRPWLWTINNPDEEE